MLFFSQVSFLKKLENFALDFTPAQKFAWPPSHWTLLPPWDMPWEVLRSTGVLGPITNHDYVTWCALMSITPALAERKHQATGCPCSGCPAAVQVWGSLRIISHLCRGACTDIAMQIHQAESCGLYESPTGLSLLQAVGVSVHPS